jgi:hypothetical protein
MMKKFLLTRERSIFSIVMMLFCAMSLIAQNDIIEFNGKVIDGKSNNPLVSVGLMVNETNISTITNSEGEFTLKLPKKFLDYYVTVSTLGYNTRQIKLSNLSETNNEIELIEVVTNLSPVSISAFKNAESLVKKVFKEKNKNLQDETVSMKAFYRETIKRRNRNVSLTEAVVNIQKQPYTSFTHDAIQLDKARKSTDYQRLDTLTVKLQGGPFSTIYIDVMKYPEYIFTEETLPAYEFSFDEPTTINNRTVYVVDFTPKYTSVNYKGKLYIDVKSLALVSANYALDINSVRRSKNLFVKKKPRDVVVYPLDVNYKVDYKSKGGKWYYSYSNLNLKFKVNKKRQIFNKVYTLSSEMAVTDWEISTSEIKTKGEGWLKPTVIITDAISGFSDPNFWGEYNLIEPDKSIESAIEKIIKNIEKQKEEGTSLSGKP